MLFSFGVGPVELVVVGLVVLLLFGNRLPSVMRSLGRATVEFKKGTQDLDEDTEDGKQKKKAIDEEKAV